MATIKIHDLSPAGSDLFQDSESFLNELTDEELGVHGGRALASVSISVTVTVTYSWTWTWAL
ncbi:hypothetical protein VF14_33345 [Nostoc linckia z18]|jgi:hypothetical protein|uniref:Uncharacterized protein n=3 Tax=Nostoc TaxID=1177 RepID=A0A9Q5ZC30_NOSLI|nr:MULTISPECIES: hypothetical protein [Nostoc]MBL1203033.1 dual specificity protein phosphatase family protein [Nostoc sp. GBBB01]MDZ8013514.1 hypothetical protein [Nostoc sp. ZfuVER08]PHK39393.1 hypothetical protein VF12_14400 [Nostoc linckia z15]PHK40995.1 hypothetical protein VF13_32050 [Nostoc linckia z16]MBC1236968.1 hypothetical protein [Nostoc sp. 2RC]